MAARKINHLKNLVSIAETLRCRWEEETISSRAIGTKSWLRLPQKSAIENFPTHRGRTLYSSAEHAGTAGLYSWLSQQECDVRFANDLAFTIHGIDAIAYDVRRAVYLLCEAKGTGNDFKLPQQYLLETQKGLQLSWDWCWRSLVGYAMQGPTARTFLEVYKPIILQERIERLLSVTVCDIVRRGFLVRETRVWTEQDLHSIKKLRVPKNWNKFRRWLKALESIDC